VLPAENATGNFVKVVQRVPVKIVFDEPADKVKRLVPGMSVEENNLASVISSGRSQARARGAT